MCVVIAQLLRRREVCARRNRNLIVLNASLQRTTSQRFACRVCSQRHIYATSSRTYVRGVRVCHLPAYRPCRTLYIYHLLPTAIPVMIVHLHTSHTSQTSHTSHNVSQSRLVVLKLVYLICFRSSYNLSELLTERLRYVYIICLSCNIDCEEFNRRIC